MSSFEKSGSEISLVEAKEFIKNYNERYPDGVKAYLVSKENVMKILSQEDCSSIKIYNGYDTTEQKCNLVLIGVDSRSAEIESGVIIERLYRF